MVAVANIPTSTLKKIVPYSQVQTFPVAPNIRDLLVWSNPVNLPTCFLKVNGPT